MQPPQAEKKLKILIVVWGLRYGGGETRVYAMAKFMAARGHDVTVCCLRAKGEKGAQLEREGGKVVELGKRYRYDLSTLPRLYRLMRREKFDVVDGQMTSGFRWASVAGKLARVPRIVATTYNTRFWKSRARRILDTLFLRLADVIVTDSRTLIDEIVALAPSLRGKEFRVVYNGVDLSTNGPIRPPAEIKGELGIAPGETVVGLVARIVPHKGHMDFLEAAKRIAAEFPSTRFLIVGRPEDGYEKVVEAKIRECGLESRARVFQYDGNIFDIMGILDVYALPSYSESLPNAVVEAMLMEIPVIATRITGLPEAVKDGETGFLIPTGDPQAIYEKTRLLLSDPGLRARMGKAGRRFAEERFSPPALGDGALAVYRGVRRA
jgi:glycosyltransferase involved in cell wall biosynthesis